MIHVKLLDGPHAGVIEHAPDFRAFAYGGTQYFIHTAGIYVVVDKYPYRIHTDVGSIHRESKDVNLTQAIEQGLWFAECNVENPPLSYKYLALNYKTRAEWLGYGDFLVSYGVSPECLRGRQLTWKERILGRIT